MKIMRDDVPMACGDEFGVNDLDDRLKDLNEIGNNEALENRLHCMFEDMGEPVVLTIKADETLNQQQFFKGLGMMRMPVTWSDDHQQDYEVYTKGHIEMGGFVNLMERVEFIGKEIVYW